MITHLLFTPAFGHWIFVPAGIHYPMRALRLHVANKKRTHPKEKPPAANVHN